MQLIYLAVYYSYNITGYKFQNPFWKRNQQIYPVWGRVLTSTFFGHVLTHVKICSVMKNHFSVLLEQVGGRPKIILITLLYETTPQIHNIFYNIIWMSWVDSGVLGNFWVLNIIISDVYRIYMSVRYLTPKSSPDLQNPSRAFI